MPVCSPKRSVFQYQAGPLSSYREITSIVTPGDAAKMGEADDRRRGTERLRQVHDRQRAALERVDELREEGRHRRHDRKYR